MFFKRQNRIAERARIASQGESTGAADELFLVAFEQMQKGHIIKRGRESIRQCAVIIDGYMHLVTSGDHVSREVYLALIEKGYLLQNGKAPSAPRVPITGGDENLD